MIVKQTPGDTDRWYGIVTCAEGGQQRGTRRSDTQTDSTTTPASDLSEKGDKLKDELDALIDEIDEVLEENAEEFVKNYVQRGGE
jgi:ubiquitin-like protein Pup